jgi:AcrR family transcriptional regulator
LGLEERRRREKENRKAAILKAARRLFFEKGFKPVTVESIAKKAELSKGSVYLYYNSKEEIYAQILLNDIGKFNRKIENLFNNGDTASSILHKLSTIYIDFFLHDTELFRILVTYMLHTDDMNLSDDVNRHIVKMTNVAIDVIERIFQYGIERGEFSPTVNLRQNRNAIWGLLNGIIALHLFTGDVATREARIRSTVSATLETYVRGLKSAKSP